MADESPRKKRDPNTDLARMRANDPLLKHVHWSGVGVSDAMVAALAEAIGAEPTFTSEDIDSWFEELDEDGSGRLDMSETQSLLRKLGGATDTESLKRALIEIDPDESGEVSKGEFEDWYRARSGSVNTMCQRVDLRFNRSISEACAAALAAAVRRSGVLEVRLANTGMSEAGVAVVREAFVATAVRRLDANDPELTEIDWSDLDIGDAEVNQLAGALSAKPNTVCQRLDLRWNEGVTQACVAGLASAVRRSGVVEVRVASSTGIQTGVTPGGEETIRDAFVAAALRRLRTNDPDLTELGWSDTGIRDREVKAVAEALRFGGPGTTPNTECRFVDLRWNDDVTEKCAARLAEAVGRKWLGWTGKGPVAHPCLAKKEGN